MVKVEETGKLATARWHLLVYDAGVDELKAIRWATGWRVKGAGVFS